MTQTHTHTQRDYIIIIRLFGRNIQKRPSGILKRRGMLDAVTQETNKQNQSRTKQHLDMDGYMRTSQLNQ